MLLYCGFPRPEIHRVFREWHGVQERQATRYMTLATQFLARERPSKPPFPPSQPT
jgi:hypothetical protein